MFSFFSLIVPFNVFWLLIAPPQNTQAPPGHQQNQTKPPVHQQAVPPQHKPDSLPPHRDNKVNPPVKNEDRIDHRDRSDHRDRENRRDRREYRDHRGNHKEWPGHKYRAPYFRHHNVFPSYRSHPCFRHRVPCTNRVYLAPLVLTNTYFNYQNGQECEVYQDGNDYVCINENHDYAVFRLSRPGYYTMIAGDWNPNTVCTVYKGWDGNPVLRFEEKGTGNPPGYWIQNK